MSTGSSCASFIVFCPVNARNPLGSSTTTSCGTHAFWPMLSRLMTPSAWIASRAPPTGKCFGTKPPFDPTGTMKSLTFADATYWGAHFDEWTKQWDRISKGG